MKIQDTLFSRKQLGALAGLDESTLTYWTREGMIRPTAGGGGKGLHRRFAYSEVNLAAVLMDLIRAGASAASLRKLAAKFHHSLDWMTSRGVTGANVALYGHLIACRQEYLSSGLVELPDRPEIDDFDPTIPRRTELTRGRSEAMRVFGWDQLVAYERSREWGQCLNDDAIKIAKSVTDDEWRSHEAYYTLLIRVPRRRRPFRVGSRQHLESLRYFVRDDDGSWSLAPDLSEALEHGRFDAIEANRLLWDMWRADE